MIVENNFTADHKTRLRFRFFLIVFRVSGIPLLLTNVTTLYYLYASVASSLFYTFTLSIIMDIINNGEELEHNMESARAVFPCLMVGGMYAFFRWRVKELGRLLTLTECFSWEDLQIKDPDTGSFTMAGLIPHIAITTRRLIVSLVTFNNIYTVVRILNSRQPLLPYNGWYPFDTSVSPAYELTSLSQLLACVISANIFLGFAGLLSLLVSIAAAQLEKLREDLLNIKQRHHGVVKTDDQISYEGEKEEKFNKCLTMSQLNECIRHHQNILSYIDVLEETLNPVMGYILLIKLIALCISAFSIVTSWGNYVQMSLGIVVYVALAVVLAFYCWFGTQLSSQVEQVRDAAWECDWIGSPILFQRSVAIIITRTNKEFTLTAAKLVPVNIKTMMNMINQSLSYFMFLLEVKRNFDDN